MCLAGIDNELAQMLRTPLPATADSTSKTPRAAKRTVVIAVVGNPSTRADWAAIGIYACIAAVLWVAMR